MLYLIWQRGLTTCLSGISLEVRVLFSVETASHDILNTYENLNALDCHVHG